MEIIQEIISCMSSTKRRHLLGLQSGCQLDTNNGDVTLKRIPFGDRDSLKLKLHKDLRYTKAF